MTKRHVPKSSRSHVLFRDDYTCRYCGTKEGERFDGKPLTDLQRRDFPDLPRGMKLATKSGICVLTIDHVVPVSRGGSNLYANLVAACQRCNTFKDDRTPEEAGMTILGILTPGHYDGDGIGRQRTILLVPGAEHFGE